MACSLFCLKHLILQLLGTVLNMQFRVFITCAAVRDRRNVAWFFQSQNYILNCQGRKSPSLSCKLSSNRMSAGSLLSLLYKLTALVVGSCWQQSRRFCAVLFFTFCLGMLRLSCCTADLRWSWSIKSQFQPGFPAPWTWDSFDMKGFIWNPSTSEMQL